MPRARHFLLMPDFLSSTGSHTGGAGQVEPDRRRDLGQGHRLREEQTRGQGVREGARSHRQRLQRRLRRI